MNKNFIPPNDWEIQQDGTYLDGEGSRYDANGKHIPFTKVDVKHPGSRKMDETCAGYRARVDKAVEKGFHLGDLSWGQWTDYCKGSPNWSDAEPQDADENWNSWNDDDYFDEDDGHYW